MVCHHVEAEANANADTLPHLSIDLPINSDSNGQVIYP